MIFLEESSIDKKKDKSFDDKMSDSDVEISHVSPPEPRYFSPIQHSSRMQLCSQLGIKRHWLEKRLQFYSVGAILNGPPVEVYECNQDGNCFFNAISMIVSGTQAHHKHVRNAVCDFIENNDHQMDPFISKGEGKQYVKDTKMRENKTWATHVEIIAVAKISHRDVYCYMSPGPGSGWLRYGYTEEKSSDAFYIRNINNLHYEVVKRP